MKLCRKHKKKLVDKIPSDPIQLPNPCDNETTRRWGENDERGNKNFLGPHKTRKALSLVKYNIIIQLNHVIEPVAPGGTPNQPPHIKVRGFNLNKVFDFQSIKGEPRETNLPGPIPTDKKFISNSEEFGSDQFPMIELTETGTQLDGFLHMGLDGIVYNCYNTQDPNNWLNYNINTGKIKGWTKQGMETVGSIITTAVLIDVARLHDFHAGKKNSNNFPPFDYSISPEELEEALLSQNMNIKNIKKGDIILIRTGWAGRWWTRFGRKGNPILNYWEYYNAGESYPTLKTYWPGLHIRAVRWLVNRSPVAVGADNKPIESNTIGPISAHGPEYNGVSAPGHLMLLNSGIHMIEDMDLEEIAHVCEKNKKWRFPIIINPIPIRGAVNSQIAPIAII